jgi:hypothetical protein
MPGYIQTVTFSTSRIDEMLKLGAELRDKRMAADEGPKPVQISICADRDVPGRYTTVIEFTSYEDAMANSNHPDTQEFSKAMGELCDGPLTFANLDILTQETP